MKKNKNLKLSNFDCNSSLLEPSNRAVTKLRYTPDKPYKLQINAVNSEVEIFGMTDDLYYIRSGKNYGFLPKQHLRETTRGNFPFQVEIDISGRLIDQQVREQNFLYEFLKSSQPAQETELKLNETASAPAKTETLPAPVNEPSQENPIASDPIASDVPLDIPLDKATEVPALPATETSAENKSEAPAAQTISKESNEDSGVEDDEDDDEDDSEEVPEKSAEVLQEKKDEQPELIAIPPHKDPEAAKIVETFKEVKKEEAKPAAEPIAASSPENVQESHTPSVISTNPDELANVTLSETPKVEEKVPEFIPINSEAVQEASILLDSQNGTDNASAELGKSAEENKIDQEEVKTEETTPNPENIVQNLSNVEEPLAKDATNNTVTEPSAKAEELVAVETNSLSEKPSDLPAVESPKQQLEIPVIAIETETIERTTETTPEIPQSVPVLVPTEVTETLEIPQPEVEVTPIAPLPLKPSPDALLQRFNEKLGNRVVDGTGKGGSVEPLNRPDEHHHHDHLHSHGHHSHETHDHQENHGHHHEEKLPEIQEDKTPETSLTEEENEQPGFFGGLYKKFFSDADDSEQHFREQAKPDNALNPLIKDQKGE